MTHCEPPWMDAVDKMLREGGVEQFLTPANGGHPFPVPVTEQPAPEIAGYILARPLSPPGGRLLSADWGSEVYTDLNEARTDLIDAIGDDTGADTSHWRYRIYALTEVPED